MEFNLCHIYCIMCFIDCVNSLTLYTVLGIYSRAKCHESGTFYIIHVISVLDNIGGI